MADSNPKPCGCGGGVNTGPLPGAAKTLDPIDELQRRLDECEAEYKRRRQAAFDQFRDCINANVPHANPELQLIHCRGQLQGRLQILEEDRQRCILDVLADFFGAGVGGV